jgi:hypothetical protein
MTIPDWLKQAATGWLTPVEVKQLDAIVLRLHPADPARGVPSGVDAGVSEFVSLTLARTESTYWEIPTWRSRYRDGLAALDAWSRATHQKTLTDLSDDQMNALIAGLEAGNVPGLLKLNADAQKTLFATLLRHTYQGCYGDPRWGGNRNKIMWRFLGILQQPETPAQIQADTLPAIPL